MSIEIVEPPTQLYWGVPCGIGSNENELDPISNARRQFLQSDADVGHMHGTLIGAIGVAEKQECHRPHGPVPEIKLSTGGVNQNKLRFRQGRRDEATPVCAALALLRRS